MCEPISIGLAVASFAGSATSAIGQHQQQQAAVARSNAIARQQYQQQMQIAAAQDQEKGRVYQAELKSTTAAKNAYYRQLEANQAEATRASMSLQNKMEERRTAAKFNMQGQIANSIQAQGEMLATGKSGQSFLLNAMQAERDLGFEMAQIEQSLYDSRRASAIEAEGILLDQQSANVGAWNNLPADPLSPMASFMPIKPIRAQGPSGLALAGGLLSSAAGATGTGLSTYSTIQALG